jgi:hypothetical protein
LSCCCVFQQVPKGVKPMRVPFALTSSPFYYLVWNPGLGRPHLLLLLHPLLELVELLLCLSTPTASPPSISTNCNRLKRSTRESPSQSQYVGRGRALSPFTFKLGHLSILSKQGVPSPCTLGA